MSFNLLAILLAGISSMVVGTVWFLPAVFGNRYQAVTGVDPNKPKRPALVYVLSFVAALVTATVLSAMSSLAFSTLGGSELLVTLLTAAGLWLGFGAAPTAVHYLFGGWSPKLYSINMGHQLVTALVMAVIVGLFAF